MAGPIYDIPGEAFTENDWLELAGAVKPGGPDVFSWERSEATLVGFIPAAKVQSAKRYLMGYSWKDGYTLRRQNPVRHPREPQLRCVGVSVQYRDVQANPDNAPTYEPYELPADLGSELPYYVRYASAEVTMHFRPLPYPIRDDDDPAWDGTEFTRNCEIFHSSDPRLEVLMSDSTAFFKFVETGSGGPGNVTPGDVNQQAFNAPIGEYLSKADLVVAWFGVDFDFLTSSGFATRLFGSMGKLNSDTFLNFAPETLLCNAPKINKYQWPYWNPSVGSYDPHFGANVFLSFSYFDPPRAAGAGGGSAPTPRGWNLFPWRSGGGPGGGPGWYAATRTGALNGPRYLATTAFADLFKAWDAP